MIADLPELSCSLSGSINPKTTIPPTGTLPIIAATSRCPVPKTVVPFIATIRSPTQIPGASCAMLPGSIPSMSAQPELSFVMWRPKDGPALNTVTVLRSPSTGAADVKPSAPICPPSNLSVSIPHAVSVDIRQDLMERNVNFQVNSIQIMYTATRDSPNKCLPPRPTNHSLHRVTLNTATSQLRLGHGRCVMPHSHCLRFRGGQTKKHVALARRTGYSSHLLRVRARLGEGGEGGGGTFGARPRWPAN